LNMQPVSPMLHGCRKAQPQWHYAGCTLTNHQGRTTSALHHVN
jgi:hypothetical protein